MTACSHGMPSPASCLDCMDEGNLPVPKRDEREIIDVSRDFKAKFDSQCPGCNLPIHKGATVMMVTTKSESRAAWHGRCVISVYGTK